LAAPEAEGQEEFARVLAEMDMSLEAALIALRLTPLHLARTKRRQCGRVCEPFRVIRLEEHH
jgi:hypothetical protein